MTDISRAISSLSPEKRTLLALKLKERGSQFNTFPLSFAQRRLWFLDQMNPGSPVYNIQAAIRLTGLLNTPALERSLDEIVSRHEILRTNFTSVDGSPVQVVEGKRSAALKIVDLSALPEKEREAKVLQLASSESQKPFDLARDRLLRLILFRLAKQEHVLLVVMSHIISDGWSMGVLIREVAALYKAFSDGKPAPLPKLPVQYADFAKWQQQWLQGENLEKQLTYWKRRLEGCPPVLELPTDHPRPAKQSYWGAHSPVILSRNLSESLKTLCHQEGATLFMVLLAAFQTLLHYYTGQKDICVGVPVANRNRAEMEGLIGFFVNTLIMRSDLSGDPSFRELLNRVREVALGAYAHQDLPFERLVEELQPVRDLSHAPLAQVAFALQNAPIPFPEIPNLTLSSLKSENGIAKTDLTLIMSEGTEGLSGAFVYNTDLFDATTIAQMGRHFQTLLEKIVANPERRLRALAPLPEQIVTTKTQTEEFDRLYERSNLTKNQLLIWIGQKLRPAAPLYNVVYTFIIANEIDPEHFQRAFQTLVNSSDALRVVVEEIDGIPQQRVISNLPYTVEYLDFSRGSDPQATLRVWAHERCQVSFDLANRLFDSALIKISEREFFWYLNQHHLICDNQSTSLIFRRMSDFYGRSLSGQLGEQVWLPAFRDYLDYEREYRSSLRFLSAKAYWDGKLADEPEPLAFYGKVPRKQTTDVQRVTCDLGFERTQKLKDLAIREDIFVKTENVSLFNIFAAVLCACLYHISGNRRISLGSVSHNRRSKAFRETIGLFMEVHPLYLTIEGHDTFSSLVKKMAVEAAETLQHSEYVISKKAYDVILNYQTALFPKFHGAPAQPGRIHPGHETDSLSLLVHDYSLSGSFVLYFDFHRDVFDERQRSQAIQCFLRIMDSFLADHTQFVDRVDLLSAAEKHHILAGFNHKDVIFPEDQTITRLFEKQAEKTPAKIAAVYQDDTLTFQELNEEANKLASLIRRLKK